MGRTEWDSSEIFDMVDWEARIWAGKMIKGEQRTTILKIEFDLFATRTRRRQVQKLNDGIFKKKFQILVKIDGAWQRGPYGGMVKFRTEMM